MYKDFKILKLTGLFKESKIVKSFALTGSSCIPSVWSLTAECGGGGGGGGFGANRRPVRLEIPMCFAVLTL